MTPKDLKELKVELAQEVLVTTWISLQSEHRRFVRSVKWTKTSLIVQGFKPKGKYKAEDLRDLKRDVALCLEKADAKIRRFQKRYPYLHEIIPGTVRAVVHDILRKSIPRKFNKEEVFIILAYRDRCRRVGPTNLENFLQRNLRIPTHVKKIVV